MSDSPSGLAATEQRLAVIDGRLAAAAADPAPAGLTDPDLDTDERWEAAQVWAHMSEFIDYWRDEMADVIARYDGRPVPFRAPLGCGRPPHLPSGEPHSK